MSYCRVSDDSDVYVWRGTSDRAAWISCYKILVAHDFRPEINGELVQEFAADGPMKAVTVLLMLRAKGLRIPQQAIDLLVSEARR
jgi:hypothetical protein